MPGPTKRYAKRRQIILSDEQDRSITRYSKSLKISASEAIRRLIELGLNGSAEIEELRKALKTYERVMKGG